jgi:hypothetical protein
MNLRISKTFLPRKTTITTITGISVPVFKIIATVPMIIEATAGRLRMVDPPKIVVLRKIVVLHKIAPTLKTELILKIGRMLKIDPILKTVKTTHPIRTQGQSENSVLTIKRNPINNGFLAFVGCFVVFI